MNRILFMVAALGMITAAAIAQTQLTNRTNSRPHNRADTAKTQNLKTNAPSDADRNNPTNTTNPANNNHNGVNTSTPNQVKPTNPNTNNPNINNNGR